MNQSNKIMNYKDEEVVYIEYQNGIPHCAITVDEKGYKSNWDFEIFYKDPTDIRFYNSGSGGHMTDIQPATYVDGVTGCSYWISDKAKLNGEPENITLIDEPILLKGSLGESINPFDELVSEETDSLDYCERCEQWTNEYCRLHQFEDESDNYELKYIDDKSLVE